MTSIPMDGNWRIKAELHVRVIPRSGTVFPMDWSSARLLALLDPCLGCAMPSAIKSDTQTTDAAARTKALRLLALTGLITGLLVLATTHGATMRAPLLAMVGVGLGFVLFQSTFGFAGSFRAVLERGDASGFKAQAVALAVSSMIFFPLLGIGCLFGQSFSGFGAGIGVAFLIGAVLFGLGMQIGGGCASGTLFALGGGNLRLVMTLVFFVIGSAVGAATLHLWSGLPHLPPWSSQDVLGWPLALAVHLAIFATVWRFAPGQSPALLPQSGGWLGPWSLTAGAVGLAALNGATLIIAGRPWGETAGFALWGSKWALWAGFDAVNWPYWRGNPGPLFASVFADITSIMDFGIILGAALAAVVSGRFVLHYRVPPQAWVGAACGGFLMGYGARLSGGCNIGAYFSALASGSLSAWAWVAGAFLGSWIGLRLRPTFRLT